MKTSQFAASILAAAALALPASAHAQSAGQAVCAALDVLKSFNLGLPNAPAIFRQFPTCTATSSSSRYYVGSAPGATNPNDLLPLVALPFVTTGSYLCGVADSHNTVASSSVGALGIESRFNVTERSGNTVKGERVGRISLFGASAVLERQDFSLSTPIENGQGHFGNYIDVTSSGISSWDWDPDRLSIPIPAGPGTINVGLDVELHGRSPNDVRGNQQLTATPASRFRYDEWDRCINGPPTCTQVGNIQLCSRPCDPQFAPVDKFRLDRFNSCPGLCDNLADGRLPYLGVFGGASGFSANYINFQPFINWFHLGRPGNDVSSQVFDQPAANINTDNFASLASNATTWGRFNVDVGYSAGAASVDLKTTTILAVRDGFAIRQKNFLPGSDLGSTPPQHVLVKTSVDAESAVDVDAQVRITLPIVGPLDFNLPNIIKSDRPSATVAGAVIDYPATPTTGLRTYTVQGVAKPQPDQARLQCQLTPTPVTRSATPISNPGEFLRNAARNSVDAIHPCNVRYCSSGRNYVCTWNAATKKLDCPSTAGCNTCSNFMQLCSANGAVIPGSNVVFGSNAHIAPGCIQ